MAVGRFAHAQQCNACHTGNVYAGLPSECVDCHLDDYNATTDPDHQSAGFPTDCETCHEPTTWTGATFDHPYSLVGVHATLDCSVCHSSGVYAGLPSDCVDCHLNDYNGTTSNPNHSAGGLPDRCDTCHRQSDPDWFQATYRALGVAVGRLAHRPAVQRLPHRQRLRGPPVRVRRLPPRRLQRHHQPRPSVGWIPHRRARPATSRPPGPARHSTTPTHWLESTPPSTAPTATRAGSTRGCRPTVSDCHLNDYNGTTSPNHSAGGFPTDCDTCHRQSDPDWFQATYAHSVWPLVGSHTAQQCNACHTGNVYAGLPSECVDCHLDDYNATTSPDHQSAGFPTDVRDLPPARPPGPARHSTTPTALVGVHATLDCSDCHSSGIYAGLPSDCVDCHINDYNGANNPNHAAAGFPTDCELCHRQSDSSWNQGIFDHTLFPDHQRQTRRHGVQRLPHQSLRTSDLQLSRLRVATRPAT